MAKYDVVIIGSGLGGLQCAFMLAKKGMGVCVLERNRVVGGCLQSFQRGGKTFDTGFHYIGGLDEGQHLHRLFKYFRLLDLPWVRLDDNCDDVCIDGKRYHIMTGHEAYAESLTEYFPDQKENIQRYTAFLKNVGDHIFDSLDVHCSDNFYSDSLFARSAKQFLHETIGNPVLRDVVSGTSLKMELAENLPLYTFAQINDSFIRSAWRIEGGGSRIAEKLSEEIKNMGGEIRTCAAVSNLVETDGLISAVELEDGETIECQNVISNAHPSYTLSLVKESKVLRHSYINRIKNLENTFGFFTANISLKPETVEYLNKNLFIYENADLWNFKGGKTDRILVSYYKPREGKYCQNIDILTPMNWSEVEQWADKPIGKRGDSYVEMKKQKTNECVSLAAKYIPGLENAVERYWASTPISYNTYTKTVDGSAYGIRKDYTRSMFTVLTPYTPIKNLLLTGQNLNLHGILGVSMTSLFTCACLLGMETVEQEVLKPNLI